MGRFRAIFLYVYMYTCINELHTYMRVHIYKCVMTLLSAFSYTCQWHTCVSLCITDCFSMYVLRKPCWYWPGSVSKHFISIDCVTSMWTLGSFKVTWSHSKGGFLTQWDWIYEEIGRELSYEIISHMWFSYHLGTLQKGMARRK